MSSLPLRCITGASYAFMGCGFLPTVVELQYSSNKTPIIAYALISTACFTAGKSIEFIAGKRVCIIRDSLGSALVNQTGPIKKIIGIGSALTFIGLGLLGGALHQAIEGAQNAFDPLNNTNSSYYGLMQLCFSSSIAITGLAIKYKGISWISEGVNRLRTPNAPIQV
jgi:hypothetical protein